MGIAYLQKGESLEAEAFFQEAGTYNDAAERADFWIAQVRGSAGTASGPG